MRIRTQCRSCGLPFTARLDPAAGSDLPCPGCGTSRPVDLTAWRGDRIERCALCGCEHLYRQRDFNRALGCGLVALGAVLVPWTWGLSLVALSLVDLLLYARLSDAVACYRCDTLYRDAKPGPRQADFDLLKHDVLKYGKSWQDVDLDSEAD